MRVVLEVVAFHYILSLGLSAKTPSMNIAGPSSPRRRWKGKGKRMEYLAARDVEGSGGTEGMVLPMDMIGTGAYEM